MLLDLLDGLVFVRVCELVQKRVAHNVGKDWRRRETNVEPEAEKRIHSARTEMEFTKTLALQQPAYQRNILAGRANKYNRFQVRHWLPDRIQLVN